MPSAGTCGRSEYPELVTPRPVQTWTSVLHWNNHPVDLPAPLDDPEIRPYAKTLLDCARERNSDEDDRDLIAECHRPKKVLGTAKFRSGGSHDQNVFHLTLTDEELETVRPDSPQTE